MGNSLEENKQQYILEYYLPPQRTLPGIEIYTDVCGWTDYYLNRSVLFSRRRVYYDLTTFPDKLHQHGFYEIVVFLGGTVSYVSGSEMFTPHYGDIMIFPPNCEHTVRTGKTGIYDRAVLYIEPDWFHQMAGGFIPPIFSSKTAGCYMIDADHADKFLDLLKRMEKCLKAGAEDAILLAGSYLSLIVSIIGRYALANQESNFQVPQKLMDIKAYIDENCAQISSVDTLAAHFYYSREHISRLFRDYYKITPSAYLRRKKIELAREALDFNSSVRYAYDISGFQSYTAFVNAFREVTGVTPGKYLRSSESHRSFTGKDL